MTREKLLKEEEKSFRDFLDDLHSRNTPGSLSHYEHNLEVSDVIKVNHLNVEMQFWNVLLILKRIIKIFGFVNL